MQRNFEPMRKQVETWQKSELTDVTAKVVIYEAFVEAKLEAPKRLARNVHDLYFEPKYEEFRSRTIWSLSNAFTSANFRIQGTRSHSTIQGHREVGRVPGRSVFEVVLTYGTVSATAPYLIHRRAYRGLHTVVQSSHSCSTIPAWNVCKPSNGNPHGGATPICADLCAVTASSGSSRN